jgi:hypothetical protein
MKELLGVVFGGAAIAVLMILLMAIGPVLLLWGLNTFSEQAHWGWHIPHNTWTYLATWAVLLVTKSSTSTGTSKK